MKRAPYIISAILIILSCSLAYKVYSLQSELFNLQKATPDEKALSLKIADVKINQGWDSIAQIQHIKNVNPRLYPFVPPIIGVEPLYMALPLAPTPFGFSASLGEEYISVAKYEKLLEQYNNIAEQQSDLINDLSIIIRDYNKLQRDFNELSSDKFKLWTELQALLDSLYKTTQVLHFIEEQYDISHKVVENDSKPGNIEIILQAPRLDSALVLMENYPH